MIKNRLHQAAFIVFLLLILSACENSAHQQADPGPDFADLINRLKPTVLNVRVDGVNRGTAFLVHHDGYLLTALHVVGDNKELEVTQSSIETSEAIVVARDEASDLALLKLRTNRDWRILDIQPGEDVRLGEWLIVLGNPFGQGLTVSLGVAGAIGNALGNANPAGWIQTDASINPGNSGGPVINIKGRVIGVATARISLGPGVGFIVPIEAGRRLLADELGDR